MKVYVAQFCNHDDIEAEEDDRSPVELDVPQFSRVFAQFGEAERAHLKEAALADLNGVIEMNEEPALSVSDLAWSERSLSPTADRRFFWIRGEHELGDIFITVVETDLL